MLISLKIALLVFNPFSGESFNLKNNIFLLPANPLAQSPSNDEHPAWLRVEVIDSGAGMSKENQKKLFGQYVQFNANSLQKGGGSGLGLWISKGA